MVRSMALFLCWALPCGALAAPAGPAPSVDPRDAAIFDPSAAPATLSTKTVPTSPRSGATSAPVSLPSSRPNFAADPRDGAIFGAGTPQPTPSPEAGTPRPAKSSPAVSALEQRLLERGKDKLQLGGQLYLRFNLAASDGERIKDHQLAMPNLLDLYLDARPNERVRAFARGRLSYDPTTDESSQLAALSGAKKTAVSLIELWLKFDIGRRLFLTIGQQRILWGTTRLWNPVDFINLSQRPILNPFDARSGVPMVKLHLPLEALGWNFYLAGLLDGVTTLDQAGAVGRAEFVFSTVELGLNAAYRKSLDPRLGLDLSAGFWDFELKGELGLRFADRFENKLSVQSSAALQYQFKVFDDDTMLVGAEYFFNQHGTDSVNPLEIFDGTRQFFYAGKHYLALFALLPRPGRLDDWTFTISGVSNLSDQSVITRLDISVTVLTYLNLQLYAQLHFGRGGELRLGDNAFPEPVRAAARALYNPTDPTRPIPNQLLDLGLWLSVDL